MICRIWHGRTPRSKADAYTRFLEERAIPDYRKDFLLEFEPQVQHYIVMAGANAV